MSVIATVRSPGLATIQDGGRPGFTAVGVPVSGAFHRVRYLVATALLSGEPDAQRPGDRAARWRRSPWRVRTTCILAVVGPAVLSVDGRRQAGGAVVRVHRRCGGRRWPTRGPGRPTWWSTDGSPRSRWGPRPPTRSRGSAAGLFVRGPSSAARPPATALRASARSTAPSASPPARSAWRTPGTAACAPSPAPPGRVSSIARSGARLVGRSRPGERLRAQHAAGAGRHPGHSVGRGGRARPGRRAHGRLPGRRGGGDRRPGSTEPAAAGRRRWPSGPSRSTRRRRPDASSSPRVRRAVVHPDHLP